MSFIIKYTIMLSITHFKSVVSNKVYEIPIQLNMQTCDIFESIKCELIDKLDLNKNEYTILLFTIEMVEIIPDSIETFVSYCDSIQYPALYFKPSSYLDRSDNINSIDTTTLTQQQEPLDTDTDSVPDLIDDSDSEIDSNTEINDYLTNNYINHSNFISNESIYNIHYLSQ